MAQVCNHPIAKSEGSTSVVSVSACAYPVKCRAILNGEHKGAREAGPRHILVESAVPSPQTRAKTTESIRSLSIEGIIVKGTASQLSLYRDKLVAFVRGIKLQEKFFGVQLRGSDGGPLILSIKDTTEINAFSNADRSFSVTTGALIQLPAHWLTEFGKHEAGHHAARQNPKILKLLDPVLSEIAKKNPAFFAKLNEGYFYNFGSQWGSPPSRAYPGAGHSRDNTHELFASAGAVLNIDGGTQNAVPYDMLRTVMSRGFDTEDCRSMLLIVNTILKAFDGSVDKAVKFTQSYLNEKLHFSR